MEVKGSFKQELVNGVSNESILFLMLTPCERTSISSGLPLYLGRFE